MALKCKVCKETIYAEGVVIPWPPSVQKVIDRQPPGAKPEDLIPVYIVGHMQIAHPNDPIGEQLSQDGQNRLMAQLVSGVTLLYFLSLVEGEVPPKISQLCRFGFENLSKILGQFEDTHGKVLQTVKTTSQDS